MLPTLDTYVKAHVEYQIRVLVKPRLARSLPRSITMKGCLRPLWSVEHFGSSRLQTVGSRFLYPRAMRWALLCLGVSRVATLGLKWKDNGQSAWKRSRGGDRGGELGEAYTAPNHQSAGRTCGTTEWESLWCHQKDVMWKDDTYHPGRSKIPPREGCWAASKGAAGAGLGCRRRGSCIGSRATRSSG